VPHIWCVVGRWLAPSCGPLSSSSIAAVLSPLHSTTDPTVLSYTALSVWGLCQNPTNRSLAVEQDAVKLLSQWIAVRVCPTQVLRIRVLPNAAFV
jgi:hypothetical protein